MGLDEYLKEQLLKTNILELVKENFLRYCKRCKKKGKTSLIIFTPSIAKSLQNRLLKRAGLIKIEARPYSDPLDFWYKISPTPKGLEVYEDYLKQGVKV